MTALGAEKIGFLQKETENIRNICILAHVDHGKTTLADALIASNGIISPRMAGKLRYMDSREDEQVRGITMKSSAIALSYEENGFKYLVNVIDSPGHVDFSSEVSTAVRLCDGALVIVDVVEGVCPQTHAVLRQAWLENIKPCLVLNKIDRLILELKLTPLEAHFHLMQILEQVNAITGTLFTSSVLEEKAAQSVSQKTGEEESVPTNDQVYDWSAGLEERDDSSIYFSPDQGNVVFASAIDGWGFSISHFAQLFASKLGVNPDVLRKTLWGDYYYHSKSKRIFKGAQAKGKKPLFVQFVLENVWAVYDAVLISRNKEKIEKIVNSMKLKISARDSRHGDSRIHLQAICFQWLPLSKSVLSMIVHHLPNPKCVPRDRIEKLLCSGVRTLNSFPLETQQLIQDFEKCSSDYSAPVIAFVSKMFAVSKENVTQSRPTPFTRADIETRRQIIQQRKREAAQKRDEEKLPDETTESPPEHQEECQLKEENGEIFLGFARVFSGTLRPNQELYVLGPRHDPRIFSSGEENMTATEERAAVAKVRIGSLYLLMGREVESVSAVTAGNVVGIAGLENHIVKSGTVSSTPFCPSFTAMYFEASPIVRVAVEPVHPTDMGQLVKGLRLLNQADPCVEILVQETGEHVLVTAGEVHLQRCLDDLRQRFACVEFNVSDPIVPFRETIVPPPAVDMVREEIAHEIRRNFHISLLKLAYNDLDEEDLPPDGLVTELTASKKGTLRLRAVPLPEDVTRLLVDNGELLKVLARANALALKGLSPLSQMKAETLANLVELRKKLEDLLRSADAALRGAVDWIWSFGPRRTGPNILVNALPDYDRPSVWQLLEDGKNSDAVRKFDNAIVNGFQLATLAGPLCDEPLMGVAFVVEGWESDRDPIQCRHKDGDSDSQLEPSLPLALSPATAVSVPDPYGPMSGQLMSAMKEACRRAFLAQPSRLMTAMYSCQIQATAEVLGKLYAVLGRRGGRVLSEEMKEGSSIFVIDSVLLVAESFGFAEEIRKRTSGLASPQLLFNRWEILDEDPYWVPTTEEELMHFGEKADYENQARKYMDAVRRRKGLYITEKTVEHAEKQRTLSKNK